MKQLNLVPQGVRQKARARQAAPYLTLAVLVGLFAAGAAWAGFGWQLRSLEADKERLIQQEQERQQLAAKTADDLKVDADLSARVTELNTLAKGDVDWNKVFAIVTALTPVDITLSNYSFAVAAQKAVTFKVTGAAPSNQSYATYAKFLTEQKKEKVITDFVTDGYVYVPSTGAVTFGVTITIPKDSLSFGAQP